MFLGIEIGGTKLQLGLGAGDGKLAALWRGSVEPSRGADGIRAQIVGAVPTLLAQAGVDRGQLRGVGIGFGGPVDDATRTVIKSHQIQGWDGFPLADWLGDMLGLPAVLGNDADVAGLGEALFGAGRGLSPVFYITIGSGIGGGLVIGGQIFRGAGKGAAEIGHLRIHHEGGDHRPREDILEHYASGWGIGRAAQRRARAGKLEAVLALAGGQVDAITAQMVGEAARRGDTEATAVLNEAWESLAQALCHLIALVCPRRIVIGGGVSLLGEKLLFEPLRQMVTSRVFRPFAECYDIVPAALGEEVVVHGALALARGEVVQGTS